MTLDNLLSLIGGRLLNEPSVTSFASISDRVSQIQRGDLFIATDQNQNSIDTALEKGAYGIVFDKAPASMDSETAWIKVESAFEAHLKLLRFHLMPKQIRVFYCDIYTLEYIQMLNTSAECKTIKADIYDIVGKLWSLHDAQILVLKDQPETTTLFPMAEKIDFSTTASLESVSLFESNLTLDGLLYSRLRIPLVMHDSFLNALGFFHHMTLSYDLDKISFIESFHPISCDNFLSPKDFGKGSLNLIFSEDKNLINDFIAVSQAMTPWIRIKLFLNQNDRDLSYNNQTIYQENEELIKALQSADFDLGVLYKSSQDILNMAVKPEQLTLF